MARELLDTSCKVSEHTTHLRRSTVDSRQHMLLDAGKICFVYNLIVQTITLLDTLAENQQSWQRVQRGYIPGTDKIFDF